MPALVSLAFIVTSIFSYAGRKPQFKSGMISVGVIVYCKCKSNFNVMSFAFSSYYFCLNESFCSDASESDIMLLQMEHPSKPSNDYYCHWYTRWKLDQACSDGCQQSISGLGYWVHIETTLSHQYVSKNSTFNVPLSEAKIRQALFVLYNCMFDHLENITSHPNCSLDQYPLMLNRSTAIFMPMCQFTCAPVLDWNITIQQAAFPMNGRMVNLQLFLPAKICRNSPFEQHGPTNSSIIFHEVLHLLSSSKIR